MTEKIWRYYCEDEAIFIYEESATIPTVCKNNALHTIRDIVIWQEATGANATNIEIDSSGFIGVLDSSVNTLQELADTLDSHNHDGRYYTETEMQGDGTAQLHWNNLTNVPDFSGNHNHDDRYYTETEVDNLINNLADDFIDLDDTPLNYVNSALKVPQVNNGETALEFVYPQKDLQVALTDNYRPYVQTDSESFEVMGYINFPGKTLIGIPSQIEVIGWTTSGGTMYWRIYDYTNAKVIATGSTSNANPSIMTDATLENLSDNQAIWEIQGKVDDDDEYCRIANVKVKF